MGIASTWQHATLITKRMDRKAGLKQILGLLQNFEFDVLKNGKKLSRGEFCVANFIPP